MTVRGYHTVVTMEDAAWAGSLLLREGASGPVLWRHTVLQVLDDYESARRHDRDAVAVATGRPDLTGDVRVDASLAALAEHLAVRDGWPVPAWTTEPGRVADGWLVCAMPAMLPFAEAETPPAFRAHGVLVTSGGLARA
jgi:hypothetical protein